MYVNYRKLLVKCCNRRCVVLNHVRSWLVGWLVWNPSWFRGLPGLDVLKCGLLRQLFLYLCSYNLDGSVTQKEASHGLLTHHLVCWVLKWTNGVHTHTLLHPRAPHKRRAHSIVGAARRPSATPSPLLRTHARKHTWEQSYALIYGGSRSVWSKGKENVSPGSMTWRWSSPYSILGYK
jgi:hypothetical protein